ncbi:MAG: toprim domain-containing protein [Sphingobacteriales bacterium]|nr:toprim domain-containing protein [Sphingobacteriales bacterium]
MESSVILCRQINELDLVDFLQRLAFTPNKIRGNDYWYLSPLREEKTASFKINRTKNVWYDHGTGQGGGVVDFLMQFWNSGVAEVLQKYSLLNASYTPLGNRTGPGQEMERKTPQNEGGKIFILSESQLSDPALIRYLRSRGIPLLIARQYCCQVVFELYKKKQLAIGFKNEGGGFELRNPHFKGSSSPKRPFLIQNEPGGAAKELTVLEGFFSFLSLKTLEYIRPDLVQIITENKTDYLILNSLAFFEKSREQMEKYGTINLLLDRDKMGLATTGKALTWSSKFRDKSGLYEQYKDLNDFLKAHMGPDKNKGRKNSKS